MLFRHFLLLTLVCCCLNRGDGLKLLPPTDLLITDNTYSPTEPFDHNSEPPLPLNEVAFDDNADEEKKEPVGLKLVSLRNTLSHQSLQHSRTTLLAPRAVSLSRLQRFLI